VGTYFSSSFAGQALIDNMAQKGISIIMSQVVPRPNNIALPIIKRYKTDLAALGADLKPGYTSLEGYLVGRVAVEAARAATSGGIASRSKFKTVLSDLSVDLGGYRVRFGAASKQGSTFVDVVALDRYGRIIG
jgi:branched-chain amino acid transport system substrate-binding protein